MSAFKESDSITSLKSLVAVPKTLLSRNREQENASFLLFYKTEYDESTGFPSIIIVGILIDKNILIMHSTQEIIHKQNVELALSLYHETTVAAR